MEDNNCSIKLVRTLLELESIKTDWDTLLCGTRGVRAFSSYSWFKNALQLLPFDSLYTITTWKSGKLTGILPLAVYKSSRSGRKYISVVDTSLTDYCDLIVEDGDSHSANRLVEALFDAEESIYGVILANLHPRGDLYETLLRFLTLRGADSILMPTKSGCPYTKISGCWEDYLASRGHNVRYNEKRSRRKLIEAGYEVFSAAESGLTFNVGKKLLELHRARRQMIDGTSILFDVTYEAFVEATLPIVLKEGHADARVIGKNGEIYGMHINLFSKYGLSYWQAGFVPELSRFGPGTLLHVDSLRGVFDAGLKEYDFMRGDEEYKDRWATASRPLYCAALSFGPPLKPISIAEIQREFNGD